MLHPCSCSQAALHNGGGLQGALSERVSSRWWRSVDYFFLTLWMLNSYLPMLTGNSGVETNTQTCSSYVLPFSSRSLAGGLCRNQGSQCASSHLRNTMNRLLDAAEQLSCLESYLCIILRFRKQSVIFFTLKLCFLCDVISNETDQFFLCDWFMLLCLWSFFSPFLLYLFSKCLVAAFPRITFYNLWFYVILLTLFFKYQIWGNIIVI